MADVLVLVDDDVALAALDGEGDDLVVEPAGLLRRLGLVLAGDGELVLRLAADLPLLGDVLGGLAHVVAVEGVPEAVLDHRVDELHVAHLLPGAQVRGVRAQRHVLLPAGGDDGGVAQHDVLRAQRHRAQARAADLVDAPGRALLGQAGVDVRLPGRVLPLGRGQHLAEDRLADLALVDAGAAHDLLEHGGAQVVGGRAGEGAVEAADGRARGRGDDDVGHGGPPEWRSAVPSAVAAVAPVLFRGQEGGQLPRGRRGQP